MLSNPSLSNSRIVAAYRNKTPASERLAREAMEVMPSGIAHDSRYLEPYNIYVTRAQGSRKWDVDGNEYVDYVGGHGALILGHNHPEVIAAVHRQLDHGTHYGSNHELEIRWGQLIKEMIPSAERVRFTSSGTEATLMALRLARAHTGRTKLVRFKGHFHGWHDHMTSGYVSHFDGSPTAGVLTGVAENVLLSPPEDVAAIESLLSGRDDIAAVIIEPTGGSWGRVPASRDFLAALRELTRKHGALLIFDEVITGFRVSPGGAQAHYGITPDLTTMAKIVAGGLPGAAVAGRRDIMDELDFEASARRGKEKIQHPGTFNANPVSAAAGVATLEILKSSDACERANAYGEKLRGRMNAVLDEEKVRWAVYGTFSGFHVFTNPANREVTPGRFDPFACPLEELKSTPPTLATKIRLGMLVNGVDIMSWPGGPISAAHDEEDLDRTVEAFRETVRMLKEEGEIAA